MAVPGIAWANANPDDAGAEEAASTTSSASALDKLDSDKEKAAKDKEASDSKTKDADRTGSAFTFTRTGTTVDAASSSDNVEFFTIKSKDNSVYYLVIDHSSTADNVCLLNTVSDSDLKALAESGTINLGNTVIPQQTAPAVTENPDSADDETNQEPVPAWVAYLAVVAIIGAAGIAYYKLKIIPEREEKRATEDEIRSFEADGIYPNNDFIR